MKSWKKPTPELVQKAVALLAHPQQARHFFQRLDNPLWIEPLSRLGCFAHPPEPIEDREKETVQFPSWPPLSYVTRMASLPEGADDAVEIALTLSKTKNITIQEDVAQIALSVPPHKAARLVPLLAKWVPPPFRMLLSNRLGDLVSYLAKGGEVDAALKLAQVLLRVVRRHRLQYELMPEATSAIDSYEFGEILERNIPDLVHAAGLRTLTLLRDLLARAVKLSRSSRDEVPGEDYSDIWRPRLDSERFPDRVLDSLVSAVRDAAKQIVERDPTLLSGCVEILTTADWLIFKRLAFELIRSRLGTADPALVASFVLDRDNLRRFLPEYRALLRDVFPRLATEQQAVLLEWIEAGPDLHQWKVGQSAAFGKTPSDEEVASWGRQWTHTRLATVGDALPDEKRQVLDALTAEFGPARPDEPAFESAVWVGPTSPIGEAELAQMSPEEVIECLHEWKPPVGPRDPSPEGLGRVMTGVVASRAQEFSRFALRFRTLDPTYVRSFIGGVTLACKNGQELDWAELLGLSEWVLGQEPTGPLKWVEDRDPGWGWARRHLMAEHHEEKEPTETLASMPELAKLLERHLDSVMDPSLAVRSVYGQWFPWIFLMDPVWANANVSQIFPAKDAELQRWSAAWNAYVVFCRPFDTVFAAMTDTYRLAILRLGRREPPLDRGSIRDPDQRLAEHLMVLYGRGKIVPETGSLLELFFECAPEALRAYAISFVGRSLTEQRPAGVPDEVLQRFMELWISRLDAARKRAATGIAQPAGELIGFGRWFASGAFPTDWAFEQLQALFELGGRVELEHLVLRRLVETVSTNPLASVEALRAIVAGDAEGWRLLGSESETSAILKRALRSGDPEAADAAKAAIHGLGSRGHFGFRRLLENDDGPNEPRSA